MPGPLPKESLEVTKHGIDLGGDPVLQNIMRFLEYELAIRDDRIAALEARLAKLEEG